MQSSTIIFLLHTRAVDFAKHGDPEKANTLFWEVVDDLESLVGPTHHSTVEALWSFVKVCHLHGFCDEIKDKLQKSLDDHLAFSRTFAAKPNSCKSHSRFRFLCLVVVNKRLATSKTHHSDIIIRLLPCTLIPPTPQHRRFTLRGSSLPSHSLSSDSTATINPIALHSAIVTITGLF